MLKAVSCDRSTFKPQLGKTVEGKPMAELVYGHNSFVRFDVRGLTIHLSVKLFRVDMWEIIRDWFSIKVGEPHWLSAPFRVMTAEEEMDGYPRWKQTGVDVLSWIMFHLLVPPDHRLVRLWQVVDWSAINRLCTCVYKNSQSGQRAWAPAQMFALLLLYFVLPVPSECSLLRTVATVPLYRWFCGFGMFTSLPDHSTLHTFRRKVGQERFEAILSLVVLRCIEQGLVANELLHFDMKGVPASARAWSPYERAVLLTSALIRYLEQVEEYSKAMLPETLRQLAAEVAIEVLGNKRLQKSEKAPSRILKSLERWTRQRQEAKGQALWEMALEQAVQTLLGSEEAGLPIPQTQTLRRRYLKEIAQWLKGRLPHACGDSDARVGWVSDVTMTCGYWLGFLADGLKGIITAVSVVPLNVVQRTQMLTAFGVHHQRCGDYPEAVAADSAQDYYPVHQGLGERQIQGHIASRDRRTHGGGFSAGYFTFDEKGKLRCPAGQMLQAGKQGRKDGRTPFRARGSDCAACSLKAKCLPKRQQPDGPRFIRLRQDSHQCWLQNREHTRTEVYKEAQKKRFASEGLFGLAARLHGADKMPYRSQSMNCIAGLLIGTAMNLAVLVRQAALT
jgi:transposase